MKNYCEILSSLLKEKIIGILRVDDENKALKGAEAMKKGGIRCIEVTMNTPGVLSVIEELSGDPELLVGAGTVLDETSCRLAILHGAEYIVTPTLNEGVIRCANRYQKPVICGCYTPTEMTQALELGVNMIKIFPASEYSTDCIKAFKGPLNQILAGPTGGVSRKNIGKWKAAGADFYGIAGELSELTKAEKYEELEQAARELVEEVQAV